MKDIVPVIEAGLGRERLVRLRRDPDAYQEFWLGVLEAMSRVDRSRDATAFLISNGYGAVRNMRRAERTKSRLKLCPECKGSFAYRRTECPWCGAELQPEARTSEYVDVEPARDGPDLDFLADVESFVRSLSGNDAYVARRWMIDRADLLYANHLRQIAAELGVSAPYVAKIKGRVRRAFLSFYYR